MASKEELKALGIETDKENIENIKTNCDNQNEQENYYYEVNKVARIIKITAIIGAIAGVILSLTLIEDLKGLSIVIIVASIISAVFVYALGEIIEKLQNIENNTRK